MMETFYLTDHLCRYCGTGRVLKRTNSGPSGGGNLFYRCSSCTATGSGLSEMVICHCFQTVDRAGINYETCCLKGDLTEELKEFGWRTKKQHYGFSILWRHQ